MPHFCSSSFCGGILELQITLVVIFQLQHLFLQISFGIPLSQNFIMHLKFLKIQID